MTHRERLLLPAPAPATQTVVLRTMSVWKRLTLSAFVASLPGLQFRMEEQRDPGHGLQVSLQPFQEVLPSTSLPLLHQAHKPLQAFIR